MIISLIAAMAQNRVIGKQNQLPWHLPADLKHFKSITMDKPIVMGRKTFESIGKALPGRQNIIITRDKNFQAENCTIVHSLDEAFEITKDQEEVMVIGGASIYEQALPKTQRIYLTLIHENIEGDTYFPEWNNNEWKETSKETFEPNEKNQYKYSFITMKLIA